MHRASLHASDVLGDRRSRSSSTFQSRAATYKPQQRETGTPMEAFNIPDISDSEDDNTAGSRNTTRVRPPTCPPPI